MRAKFLFFLPFLLNAESFNEIVKNISNSYIYKLAQNEVRISKKTLEAIKAVNLGKVDFSYNGVRFFNTPTMKLSMVEPVGVSPDGVHLVYKSFENELPMSDKEHFIAELKYTYPIFSGFLVTANIQKAKIKLIQSNLKLQNTRRVLILNSAKLYSSIYALNQQLKALISAKKSLILAKDKVNALYEEGLVDKSQVSEIEAKYYEIDSTIKEIDAKRKNLINTLNTLLNISIKDVEGLDNINLKSNLLAKNRPDVKEVYKRLEIAKIEEKIAKSNFYPKVGFVASLKREGDNFFITKNDYQNIDKSFVGIGIEWNLFNGGADRKKLEITKIAKLQSLLYYKNYLNDAKRELKDDLNILRALNSRLKASFLEVKAREEYYQKIKSKFEEGLADSVDLSNAIAKLAEAKSKRDYIKSQIFFYTIKANLDGGKSD